MILRIWHLNDSPKNGIGSPYLHREVEDWIAGKLMMMPSEEREAPDLATTDPAGVTTFVAAYGLGNLAWVDVSGMETLEGYPGELAFVGFAHRMIIAEPMHEHTHQVERRVCQDTGQIICTPVLSDTVTATWQSPRKELRLRGLVVDKTTLEDTITYVESRIHRKKGGDIDIIL